MLAVRTPESPPNYVTNKQKSLSLHPRASAGLARRLKMAGSRTLSVRVCGTLAWRGGAVSCEGAFLQHIAKTLHLCRLPHARALVPPGRLRSGVSLPLARRCLASLPLPAVAAPGVSAEGSGPSRHHSSPVQTCRSRSAPNGPTVGFPTVSVAALPFPPGSGGGVGALVGCWPW